jgi:hypothetical protein
MIRLFLELLHGSQRCAIFEGLTSLQVGSLDSTHEPHLRFLSGVGGDVLRTVTPLYRILSIFVDPS